MNKELFNNRKKTFEQISDEIIGSNTAIIGNRSQLYDSKHSFLRARALFSFTIRHARILDITTSSRYSPKLDSLKDQKLKFWFSDVDKKHTDISKKFDEIIQTALDMRFIKYDATTDEVSQNFKMLWEPLRASGKVVRDWLKDPAQYMTRKLNSTEGIILLDCVNQLTPIMEQIPYQALGINKTNLITQLSRMETFGIIKQTLSGKYIPYLSFELFGDDINKGLDDMLEDKHNRAVFEWIRKLPGISLEKIENIALEELNIADKEKLLALIGKMQANGFIEIHQNNEDNNEYIVPVWLRKEVLDIKPTRIESDMIGNAILSCGGLWKTINSISEYYILVENTIECLNSLLREKELSFKEILDIDRRIAPLLVSFYNRGLLGYKTASRTFSITSEASDITKVIIDILKISSESNLWSEFVRGTPNLDNIKNDLDSSANEIHLKIEDKYTPKDLKKFAEYK